MMPAKHVHARFVHSANTHPPVFLHDTPLVVVTALHSIYPLLIAANRMLSFITWTSESHYRNAVLIAIYVLIVLYWNSYIIMSLPLLTVLAYCCFTWFIRTSFVDYTEAVSTNTNRHRNPPTIDEIIDTLDNFTMRFSFMLNFDADSKDFKPLLINLSLLTPFYVYIMKHYISYKTWLICVSVYFLIYYSTWFIALRRLLFRLKIVKQILTFFTNENHSVVDNEIEVALLNLNTKNSIDSNLKIIEFQLLENERRWVGIGWCKKMLFLERSPFCTLDMKHSFNTLNDFQFPKLKNYANSKWIWIDKQWVIENNGWTYYDNHWTHPRHVDSITKYTRSRHLRRQCMVVLHK